MAQTRVTGKYLKLASSKEIWLTDRLNKPAP